jgi:actin-related protein|tara:strand:+ start:442 stop:690 length:249 start_codon:yes stop_codon:yes gene_type:complete
MIPGFGDRIYNELQSSVPTNCNLSVIPDSKSNEPGYNAQRKNAAWIGGSIFASLDTFSKVVVSKQEYEDAGSSSNILDRKTV